MRKEQGIYCKVLEGDCFQCLSRDFFINRYGHVHLTFFDPPYRQGKDYAFFDDAQPIEEYWSWIKQILSKVFDLTVEGGSIYFMQREKNAQEVLEAIRDTGWTFQNLIVWKKRTSAVPNEFRFSKQYQIITFATKGRKPRVFNRLRVDLPLRPGYKYKRENGLYLTDVWDDIRELTAGYFAGDEALRDNKGNRIHTQQSPVALLLRIVLSSTLPHDTVLDPLAGTGPTLVVANQLQRNSIGIEIDLKHAELIRKRVKFLRKSDVISKYCSYYRFTPNLKQIWPIKEPLILEQKILF